MARTPSSTESKIFAGAAGRSDHHQVWIKDADDNWVELTDYEGMDLVESWDHAGDIDQPVEAASIKLIPDVYDLHLSPLVGASKINLPGGVQQERIAINREVVILVATVPMHSEPAAADWRLLFHGDCDQLDVATMTLQCVDLGGRLQRLRLERTGKPATSPGSGAKISDGGPYIARSTTTTPNTEPSEDVMQAILDDWAPALSITLATPVSPSWELAGATSHNEGWRPSDTQNVLDVLRSIAGMIGWDVRYKFDATLTDPFGVTAAGGGVGGFALTFYEPDRSNTTPVITLAPNQYYSITQLEDALATVANRVEVFYQDELGDVRSVIAEDTVTSQAAYGVLYMRVPVDATVGIITEANADLLAAAILNDVVEPTAAMGCEAPFRYDVEIYDLIRFSSNDSMFDSNQDLAVAGFRHNFSGGKGSTQIILRGSIAGHRGNWWLLNAGSHGPVNGYEEPNLADGSSHETDTATPASQVVTEEGTLGGIDLRVPNLPPGHTVEWYLDTATFTPSEATHVASSASSEITIPNLVQGTTYYARAIVVSPRGVRSAASAEVSLTPGQTIAQLEVTTSFAATKTHADGQPFAVTVDAAGTNNVKNPSFEVDLTGWEELSPSHAAPTISRDTTQFLFGAASCKVINADATGFDKVGIQQTTAYRTAAVAGETWTASAWVRFSASSGVKEAIIYIWEENDAGTYQAGDDTFGYIVDLSLDTWYRLSVTRTLTDADTTKIRVLVGAWSELNTCTLFIDGVQLEELAAPSNYFDGSFGQGYAWTGTADDSTSTRTGGLRQHGAMQAGSPEFAIYDDGEVSHGPLTPSDGTACQIGLPGHPFRIAGGGAEFPTDPTTNDTYFRTDRGILYYWDGTYWLSVQEYAFTLTPYGVLPYNMSAAGVPFSMALPDLEGGTTLMLQKFTAWTYHTGAPMASNYWTVSLKNSAGTTIYSFATNGDTTGVDTEHLSTGVDSVRTRATDKYWYVQTAKTAGSPGNLTIYGVVVHCRLIG